MSADEYEHLLSHARTHAGVYGIESEIDDIRVERGSGDEPDEILVLLEDNGTLQDSVGFNVSIPMENRREGESLLKDRIENGIEQLYEYTQGDDSENDDDVVDDEHRMSDEELREEFDKDSGRSVSQVVHEDNGVTVEVSAEFEDDIVDALESVDISMDNIQELDTLVERVNELDERVTDIENRLEVLGALGSGDG